VAAAARQRGGDGAATARDGGPPPIPMPDVRGCGNLPLRWIKDPPGLDQVLPGPAVPASSEPSGSRGRLFGAVVASSVPRP